jgi:glycosyltransferase involved in cell wall biosynthesis
MISGDRSLLPGKKGAFWYMLEAFSKHWERIDVIVPAASDKTQAASFFGNVFVHASPHGLWYQPLWILKKGKELHAMHHHAVMTVHEYPPFYNGLGAMLLKRKIKTPAALEVHHLVGYPRPASLTEWIGRILTRLWLPLETAGFSAVRTVNTTVANQLLKWMVAPRKVQVVPSFYLDRAAFAALPEVQKQYDVAFCARLVANKGLAELLHALVQVPSATLLVVGDGPERQKMETLAKQLNILHRVEFRGWVETQREVMTLLKSARVFVMNSTSEGGPRVALEAMACGLPVIATRVGVMPDVVVEGVNGLFTTGTSEDLAVAITTLLSDQAVRARMGAQAQTILDRFDRDRLIANYAHFLQSLT